MKKLTSVLDCVKDDIKIWRKKRFLHKYPMQNLRDDMLNYKDKRESIEQIVKEINRYDIDAVLFLPEDRGMKNYYTTILGQKTDYLYNEFGYEIDVTDSSN